MKKSSSSSNDLNIIAAGTTIEGSIISNGNVRLEGTVKGKVECGAVFTLGENGIVNGDVIASDAVIGGKVNGSVKVKSKITLEGKSVVSGELECARLSIDEGAVFEGNSKMGSSKPITKNEKVAEPS